MDFYVDKLYVANTFTNKAVHEIQWDSWMNM